MTGELHNAVPAERLPRLLRGAVWLIGLTLAYNVVEAGVSLWAGGEAGSIALIGFGLDSVIEMSAAVLLLWRLSVQIRGGNDQRVEATERSVHRWVGGTFLLLAAYVLVQSLWTLWSRTPPAESLVGIVLAAASLVVMPLVSWGKLRLADRIGSGALRAEAKETLACSYLSFTLLLGLTAHALVGWWWADPIAALAMTPWLIHEGREGLHGGCGCE